MTPVMGSKLRPDALPQWALSPAVPRRVRERAKGPLMIEAIAANPLNPREVAVATTNGMVGQFDVLANVRCVLFPVFRISVCLVPSISKRRLTASIYYFVLFTSHACQKRFITCQVPDAAGALARSERDRQSASARTPLLTDEEIDSFVDPDLYAVGTSLGFFHGCGYPVCAQSYLLSLLCFLEKVSHSIDFGLAVSLCYWTH